MYLKQLKITSNKKIIRNIFFRKGINLIVDESEEQITGNNVGKTTVLKLIDFCFGADQKHIYVDPETKKNEYSVVKDFLINNEVLITLILKENLDISDSNEIIIERNFLKGKECIKKIDGENLNSEEFEAKLSRLIFPNHKSNKPTFRQIISHNIRYKDESINNTLKTLDKYTKDEEYETLYLYLLGCEFDKGSSRQDILYRLNIENSFKKRLEKIQTKNAYETALSLVKSEIKKLDEKKSSLNLNDDFEEDLDKLSEVKYQINKNGSEINKLNIRKDLINETNNELEKSKFDIDLRQLHLIYQQSTDQIGNLQKTFDELVNYHNRMIDEKSKFANKELPIIEKQILEKKSNLKKQLVTEKELTIKLSKTSSYEELEKIILELNEQYRKKGEYESVIKQIEEVEENIATYSLQLEEIDNELFSNSFEQQIKTQINKFNEFFSEISYRFYGEKYLIKYEKSTNKRGQKLYKFSAFNSNMSSGQKQGEISCFDIAYILFADQENIPTLHFLLNDKKELMHDNQLVKITELVNEKEIQFVASILKDKLPTELDKEEFFIIRLSQNDKLFRIENTESNTN